MIFYVVVLLGFFQQLKNMLNNQKAFVKSSCMEPVYIQLCKYLYSQSYFTVVQQSEKSPAGQSRSGKGELGLHYKPLPQSEGHKKEGKVQSWLLQLQFTAKIV